MMPDTTKVYHSIQEEKSVGLVIKPKFENKSLAIEDQQSTHLTPFKVLHRLKYEVPNI